MPSHSVNRRRFLGAAALGLSAPGPTFGAGLRVAIVIDPAAPVASSAPATWAAGELQRALEAKGATVRRSTKLPEAAGELCIVAAGRGSAPDAAGALALTPGPGQVLHAAGRDAAGQVYALLELAARVA